MLIFNKMKKQTMQQTQSKIVEYRLIAANSQDDLEFEVNKKINEGNWQPYGPPFPMQDTIFQGVVKYAEQ